jgi:hypothetical protein
LIAILDPLICVLFALDLWRQLLESNESEEAIRLTVDGHHKVILKVLLDLCFVYGLLRGIA